MYCSNSSPYASTVEVEHLKEGMDVDVKPSVSQLGPPAPPPPEAGDVKDVPLLVVPAKLPQSRRLKQGNATRVAVNGYVLDLKNAIERVYKYELKFVGIKTDGTEKDLTRGPKNDVAVTLRRRVLFSVCMAMIKNHPDFFGTDAKNFAYDCGINFYAFEKLSLDRKDGDKEFRIELDKLSSHTRDYFGTKFATVLGRLLPCEEVYLHDTAAVSDLLSDRERSLVQFLEIITTEKMHYDQDHLVFGNKMYEKTNGRGERPLRGGKVLTSGLQKNVRFIGDSWEDAVPMVQIDSKKSAFFKEEGVMQLILDLTNNSISSLRDERVKQKVSKQLKDLVVRTTHMPTAQRTFSIFGISTETSEQLHILVDGQNVSVAEYFMSKYRCHLKYPNLPCIIERRLGAENRVINSFHPIEVLEVVKGQRVPIKKQTPDLVDELIQNCRLLPSQLMGENENQRRGAHVETDNPYLRKLGIQVISRPQSSEAQVMLPPAILYQNGSVEPTRNGDMDWRLSVQRGMPNRIFFKPATPPRKWMLFRFSNACHPQARDRFVDVLIQRAKQHGLMLNNPARKDDVERTDLAALTEKMNNIRKGYVEFVLFLTREKKDPVHDVMKLCEVRCGVITQHVHSKTLEKAIGQRGAEMVLDNILMKMNLKLGGITHAVGSSRELKQMNRIDDVIQKEWLRSSRMFIALDMSHSAPQSLFDRQSGVPPSEPTVVGMSYSCGDPFSMKGEYWMQEPRKYTVQYLKEHMVMALKTFKGESTSKTFPEHVFVFRGGASEGEFAKVITEEAAALREAFAAVAEGGRPLRIRLTILVVQSNSNYRMFPDPPRTQGNATVQNVQPGTCIDTGSVHPTHTEFLLVPHKSIMGTAKPIRCTLLVDDEPRLSMDELEGVTNSLCYMHGIVTSPVSMPAHLYAASELAKRGRNNWKIANYGEDEGSVASGEEGGRYRNDGSEDFFSRMSEDLAPKVRHKFWA